MSPTHFFFHMTLPEAAAYMRGLQRKERDQWEMMRVLRHAIFQKDNPNELELEDVLRFTWDEKKDVEVDNTEIERLREKAKKIKL